MKRKKTARNAPAQKPSASNAPSPVTAGNVFATFMREAQSIGNEVEARRAFDTEVSVYLKEKSLVDDFEGWRKARNAPAAT